MTLGHDESFSDISVLNWCVYITREDGREVYVHNSINILILKAPAFDSQFLALDSELCSFFSNTHTCYKSDSAVPCGQYHRRSQHQGPQRPFFPKDLASCQPIRLPNMLQCCSYSYWNNVES